MEYALIVFRQICIMAMMVGVGFLLAKLLKLDMEGSRQMSQLLTRVVTACVIFRSFLEVEADAENLSLLFASWLLCLIGHLIAMFLGKILFLKQKKADSAVGKFSLTFTNNGFLGIPLVMALCGTKGVFFASAAVMISNALTWSYGLSLFQEEKKGMIKKLATQPTLWAVAAGLAAFLLRMFTPLGAGTLPPLAETFLGPLQTVLNYLADMYTPLAMTIMGLNLYYAGIKQAFLTPKCYFISFLRQMFIPFLLLLVMLILPFKDRELLLSVYVVAACPCAMLTSILAVQYGNQTQQTEAARTVVVSTLFSPLTIPLMVLIGSLILGI